MKTREIKFRVWIPRLNKIVYLGSSKNDTALWIEERGFHAVDHFTGKPETLGTNIKGDSMYDDGIQLMQFTGLLDCNGKEIYEGDILKDNIIVCWREDLASFALRKEGWLYDHFFGEAIDAGSTEIIGNIFQNPELLKS